MRFQQCLAVLGCAGALLVATVTPAVATTSAPASPAPVVTVPCVSLPLADQKAAAVAKLPPSVSARHAAILKCKVAPGAAAVPCPPASVVYKDGKAVRVQQATVFQYGKRVATPMCQQFLLPASGLTVPQGAPETGGGGMAGVVSSWG